MNTPSAFTLLRPEIQRALQDTGYHTPTPIQAGCIPPLLDGRDLLGSAQTGTGKTAAFTLPLLHMLTDKQERAQRHAPLALILAPTRELAAQIGASMETYGRHLKLHHCVIFGGVNQFHQVKALARGPEIVVATPGRLLDLMQQGHVRLDSVRFLVLDEVDRMLDMGFLPDVKRILARIPKQRQTLFFSATMPPAMLELAGTFVRDAVRVEITPDQPAVERISQKVLFVGRQNKDALLASLLDGLGAGRAIVFTKMKHAANRVVAKLESAGIRGAAIHGNKSQGARVRALDGFKNGAFRVLVATDVAARGIDVDGITHVINYDLPTEPETYVHRIGRTARAGAEGDAISFCTADDRGSLRQIEGLLGKSVTVDIDHDYHCEASQRGAGMPARSSRGSNGGREPRRSFKRRRR